MKPVIEKLSKGSHGAQGADNRACIMELVSVLANEPWSDKPKCVAPTIRSFCIWVNDNGTQAHRDKLMLLAHQIVNTRDPQKDPARAKLFAEYALWCAERAAKSAESAESAAKYAEYAAESAAIARSAAQSAASAAWSAAKWAAESAQCAAESAELAAEWAEYAVKWATESAGYAKYASESAESKTMIFGKALETLERVLAV